MSAPDGPDVLTYRTPDGRKVRHLMTGDGSLSAPMRLLCVGDCPPGGCLAHPQRIAPVACPACGGGPGCLVCGGTP